MYGNEGGFRPKRITPPIEVGEEIDVHIEAVGEKGDGLAKVRGFVLFVPGAKEGEDCRVKVTRVLRKVGFADKIGEAQSKPVESEAPAEAAPEEPAAEPEPQYEDTETFGEEQPAEEAPAEEAPAEEQPAEEPQEEPAEEEKKE